MHVIKNLKKVVNQQTFTIINSKGIHHFPGGSDDKESTCNAGDLGSIPGLGWENPLEDGMVTHSTILA